MWWVISPLPRVSGTRASHSEKGVPLPPSECHFGSSFVPCLSLYGFYDFDCDLLVSEVPHTSMAPHKLSSEPILRELQLDCLAELSTLFDSANDELATRAWCTRPFARLAIATRESRIADAELRFAFWSAAATGVCFAGVRTAPGLGWHCTRAAGVRRN